jgi:sugar-specific transcriptional regulator TrmB
MSLELGLVIETSPKNSNALSGRKADNTMSKNGKATLIKSNGDRISNASQEAVETVQSLRPEIGEELKRSLLEAINFTPILSESGGDETPSYSRAKLESLGSIYKDNDSLIEALQARAKGWQAEAENRVEDSLVEFSKPFLANSSLFLDGEGNPLYLKGITPEGIRVEVPADEAVQSSIRFLLFSMSTLSNMAFLGQSSRAKKNGKKAQPKPSIFNNPSRGVESEEFGGGNENWAMRGNIRYLVNNGIEGAKHCKAIELVVICAKLLNTNQPSEAEKIFKVLTGQVIGDFRFKFDPNLIKSLVIARCYGLLNTGARQWIKELKEQPKQAKPSTSDSKEIKDMVGELVSVPKSSVTLEEVGSELSWEKAENFVDSWAKQNGLSLVIKSDDDEILPRIRQFSEGLISEGEFENWLFSYANEQLETEEVTA